MKNILSALCMLPFYYCFGQNVGIGTSTPAEKLDVNGNVNITGTIKANGAEGTTGQVLSAAPGGTLQWLDISSFKNIATIRTIGSGSWDIPDGVTRVMVEIWGAGGGALTSVGGGGGGYIAGFFNVDHTKTFTYFVGSGGAGSSGTTAENGTSSYATYNSSVTITGTFGHGGQTGGVPNVGSHGGSYSVTPSSFTSYWGANGVSGEQKKHSFHQASATVFYETFSGGRGGDAGNTIRTGGDETYGILNITTATLVRFDWGSVGKIPGGGGSAGNGFINPGSSFSGGYAGANGMIIFRY